ncbi:MAG: hypothetical protein B6241_09665 [Spirochaetaceae bacterium 4572_59]|nr:MAG: hypothetical protein B6241_09665 [Spirochaetaceae bacterium 4572_59]
MKKCFFVILLIPIILMIFSCDEGSSDGADLSGLFYEAGLETAPVVTDAASAGTARADAPSDWNSGSVPFEFNEIFKEYDPADEMSVGINNLFKLLNMADLFFGLAMEDSSAHDPVELHSPFDFGRTAVAYDHFREDISDPDSVNYFAAKEEGEIQYGLLCYYRKSDSGKENSGVIQASFNDTTGALDLDLLGLNDGDGLRIKIVGNADTHEFTKLMVGRSSSGGKYSCWYTGVGYAKGDGKSFLLKADDDNGLLAAPRYFEFPADPTESNLHAISSEGTADTSSTYRSAVDGLAYFDFTDHAVVPTSLGNGTGGDMIKPSNWPSDLEDADDSSAE